MKTSSPFHAADRDQSCCTWPLELRIVVSLLLALHVSAIYVGPFSMGAMGVTSPLAQTLRQTYRPYLEAIATQYQGYQFFNEPGPSHLIRYELEFADGRPMVGGQLPDINVHWPRLRYHRHFMLTETAYTVVSRTAPPTPPPGLEVGSPAYESWRRFRDADAAISRDLLRSYAEHLMFAHGATRVKLFGIERRYPTPEEVMDGIKPGDPRFVSEELLDTFTVEAATP
jgi:hypothetical protein